jgi:hypothetical protein
MAEGLVAVAAMAEVWAVAAGMEEALEVDLFILRGAPDTPRPIDLIP